MTPNAGPLLPRGYDSFLESLKDRIRHAQVRAALSVNRELVLLYWSIGKDILTRQKDQGWGTKVIDRLATDLRKAFPQMSGLSARNLKYMRAFAEAWPQNAIVQATLAQITWFHNLALLEKLNAADERLWYAGQTIENGWSRNSLVHQIEAGLYQRQGKAPTNFSRTLPAPQSELAQQVIKDPYNFDFLTMGPEAQERELEQGLLEHLRDFLMELGVGFAFVGSQYPLQVGGQEFRIDLLFFHLKLRAFVVLDLKLADFQPEFAGKMNFYLSAVDETLRHPDDKPSIGIIICKSKNRVIAEYALRDLRKPLGVSEYRVTAAIPKRLRGSIPTIEELEVELKGKSPKRQQPQSTRPSS